MATWSIVALLIITGGYASAHAEHPGNVTYEVTDIMLSYGFENVRVYALAGALVVEYENRIYFREKDAIGLIIPEIMDAAPGFQTLILVPKRDDVPLFHISLSREDYLSSAKNPGFFDKLEISREVVANDHASSIRKYNSTTGKVDIVLRPDWVFLLGRFNDPLIHQFGISPEFSIYWGKGIRSSIQTRFLLYDELDYMKNRVALTGLCLDYTYRHPDSILVNLGGGYFGEERYGLSTEALLFGWDDRLGIRGTAAWLGNMYYWNGILYYTRMWKWTALADLQYRLPFWNTLFTVRFGRFLYMDRGISSEVTRFFRNSCLTIFAAKTNYGSIGGFEIQFLTYPHRHPKPRRIRVRLPTLLNMRYRYLENNVGIPFSPGYGIDYATDSFWLMNIE